MLNFTILELCHSDTAAKYRINNMPDYRRLTSLIFRDLLKTYGTKTVKSNIMSGVVQMFQATFNRKEWNLKDEPPIY